MSLALISLPKSYKKDEVIEVKCLLSHQMETGYRRNISGDVIARDILKSLKVTFQGQNVFAAELSPAIAANPYIAFFFKASIQGQLLFEWQDTKGEVWREVKDISFA